LQVNLKNLKALYDAGVKIGFGTDAGATPLRIPGFAEHRELALMVDAGLTPLQAIHIATQNAAQLLGLDDRGVLANGKRADFVVLDKDPSNDIEATTKIDAVWQRGRQVSGPIDTFKP
jgi:imidazolonepropionase-like amidohydrolase